MKRNSAAFLSLLLSVSMAVTPSAAALADTDVPDQSVTAESDAAAEADSEAPAAEVDVPAAGETVPETPVPAEEETPSAETPKEAEDAGTAEKKADSDSKSDAKKKDDGDTSADKDKNTAADKEAETESTDRKSETAATDASDVKKDSEKKDSDTEKKAAEEKKDEKEKTEEAADASTSSKTHGITVTTTNAEGGVSGMYSMENAVATEQEDGSWLIRMHQISANRNLMAITDSKDKATAHEVDWYQGGGSDGYWFTVRVSSLSAPIHASFSSTERVQQGKAWGNVMTLTFDASSLTDTDAAAVTTAEISIDPAAKQEEPAVDPAEDKKDEPTTDPTEDTKAPADGVYSGTAETNAKMFKVTDVKLTSKNGKMTAVVTLSGTGYDYLYAGTKEEAFAADESKWIPAVADADGKYTYELPVSALDQPLAVASRSAKYASQGKGAEAWQDRTITISSESLKKLSDLPADDKKDEPAVDPADDKKDEPAVDPSDDKKDEPTTDPTEDTKAPADGVYSGTAETNAKMFKVTDVKLTSKDGKMTAVVTLSGTGYDYLYAGTKEEAFAADESKWIPAVADADGKYTYELPVSALDQPLAVASRSAKYASQGKGVDAWLDRTITISSDSLKKISDLPSEEKPSDDKKPTGSETKPSDDKKPSGGETKPSDDKKPSDSKTDKPAENDKKAEKESRYESDLSGATSAVDSSTTLKDGVYTPSSFSWSGGTGKVSISCTKVTVTGGKAYATIVFSSSKYGYVKANGNTYYPTVSGGSTIFTIPVELNKNQQIIGMTTAMSQPHEITYGIFVALPVPGTTAADTSASASGMVSSDNKELDEKAPEIVGLDYRSETKLEHAELFKIYNYENGVTLLEVDMTKDTDRDPSLEKNQTAAEKENKKKKAAKKEKKASSTKKEKGPSPEEVTAALYSGNVVKYLIVPENEEVPVGLEKDMILVQLPADDLYLAAETGYAYLEDLQALDLVKAVSVKEKDCSNETIKKAMEEKKVIFGGTADKPDFKNLVKEETDLAVMPASLLPGNSGSKNGDADKELKDFQSLTERFAFLGIPAVFDRSADEKSAQAQAEWIKVYSVLAGSSKE